MKPIAWIAAGLALSWLAKLIEGMGDLSAQASERLPLYIPALLVLTAGQYCVYRGLRSGVAAVWSGAFDRRQGQQPPDPPRARRLASDQGEVTSDSDFDADAVFARYLESRQDAAPAPPKHTPPLPARRPAAPPSAARPAKAQAPAQPGFGRRIV
ncbi:hypothetical protein FHS52_002388 [Erythromicrobium ramosum]|uniref:Uncharacterized protein n=1 Tax=Erythrobacter ramosus TaxID=35811 RepID=A0A6I4UHZ7_9SPHN|nr:hypothetical protein [Erythrobacter ramosus]MBB3776419.1 hypothetical protein [Erythrobacter ramosus]MXP38502.1 hypothetical protein [Erythrobacter ramosus]